MSSSPTTLVGNLTRDPEVAFTASGTPKTTFSIACNHSWKNAQSDEWEEDVSFFNVIAWRALAEDAGQVLEKGLRVVVTGRLDQRSYETDDGEKKNWVELVADDIAVSVKAIDGVNRKVRDENGGNGRSNSGSKPKPAAVRRTPAAVPADQEEPF